MDDIKTQIDIAERQIYNLKNNNDMEEDEKNIIIKTSIEMLNYLKNL
jgi:hypothetical protein